MARERSVEERARSWRTADRRRWCCLTPFNGTCREGVRWIEGNGVDWTPVDFEPELVATLFATVLSNLCGLPTIIAAAQRSGDSNRWRHALTFSLSLATSVMYHVTDAIQNGAFGLNPGQWHRLDQLFALLSFGALCEHVAQTRCLSPSVAGGLTWTLAALVLVLQEKGPWSIENTAIPAAASVALVLWSLLAGPARRTVVGETRKNRLYLLGGITFALASAVFFVLGLDDKADTCRLLHSAWHVLSGAGSFCLFQAGCCDSDAVEFEGRDEDGTKQGSASKRRRAKKE